MITQSLKKHFNWLKNIFVLSFLFLFFSNSFAMEVAITVDDLPANGDLSSNSTRMKIADKMLKVFHKHHITGVYGMINASQVKNKSDLLILQKWIKQGQYLGSHTYSHLDLAKTNIDDYIADIQKNESLLNQLMKDNNYKYFRYPYLAEGNTQEKRDTIRQFLFANQYHLTPVTVDFFEYEWIDPYVRCLNNKDKNAITWLKQSYLEQSLNALIIAHELSTFLFQRDIKNILLIHINEITADMLDEMLTAYEGQGVKFIPLSEALSDDVYKINSNILNDRSYTFLNQVRLARGLKNPDIVAKLYDTLPEEQLSQLCR